MLDQRKKRGTNGLGENNLGFRIKKMGKYSTEVRRMRCSEDSVWGDGEINAPLAAGGKGGGAARQVKKTAMQLALLKAEYSKLVVDSNT